MQKLILDTNVVVSALISNSIPTRILYDLVLAQKVETCLSDAIFAEYAAVLSREKFAKFTDFRAKANIVLARLREIATFHRPYKTVAILTDASDNKFLELAIVSSADYFITGNTLDFTISEFERTKVVTPSEYWNKFAPKE